MSPAGNDGVTVAPASSSVSSHLLIGGTRTRASSVLRQGAAVGSPYAEQTTFKRGQLLQERFKILRFIAKGGAGEVYEAQDLELRCPVALKVARPEISENENAIERFRREIALARQVTHPNVCRIFDVFRYELPPMHSGMPGRQTLFLTMELLSGESLASRIHRLGPMEPEEALPLIEGMVRGLDAAHKVGVIHRDFKSANVVLVEELSGTRSVITDFGLARGHMPDDSNPDITISGTVVGTPNYMSPEQLTGGDITPLVDMYALGIVVYEMMTGTRPFRGETDLSTAVKRLTESPSSPRVHAPDLDEKWERTILRCLEREPQDRFPQLTDVPRALRGEIAAPAPKSIARELHKRTLRWAAAIAVPLLLAVAILLAVLRKNEPLPATIDQLETPRVAILDFQDLSGKPETRWLSTGMAEMIHGELATQGDLLLVPRASVGSAVSELGIHSGAVSLEEVERLRRELGSDLVVEGTYAALADGQLRLQMRVYDPAGSVVTITERGSESELFDLIARAAVRLRERLATPPTAGASPPAATPESP